MVLRLQWFKEWLLVRKRHSGTDVGGVANAMSGDSEPQTQQNATAESSSRMMENRVRFRSESSTIAWMSTMEISELVNSFT